MVAGLSAHASSFSEIRKHPACPLEMRNQKASCLHAVCMLRVCNNNAVCTTLGLTRTSYIVYDHMYVYFNAKNMVYIHICEVGQNRISAPYMTVCMVISPLKITYVHRIYYTCMVLASPIYMYGWSNPARHKPDRPTMPLHTSHL